MPRIYTTKYEELDAGILRFFAGGGKGHPSHDPELRAMSVRLQGRSGDESPEQEQALVYNLFYSRMQALRLAGKLRTVGRNWVLVDEPPKKENNEIYTERPAIVSWPAPPSVRAESVNC